MQSYQEELLDKPEPRLHQQTVLYEFRLHCTTCHPSDFKQATPVCHSVLYNDNIENKNSSDVSFEGERILIVSERLFIRRGGGRQWGGGEGKRRRRKEATRIVWGEARALFQRKTWHMAWISSIVWYLFTWTSQLSKDRARTCQVLNFPGVTVRVTHILVTKIKHHINGSLSLREFFSSRICLKL